MSTNNNQATAWKIALFLVLLVSGVVAVWFIFAKLAKHADKWQELADKVRSRVDDLSDAKDFAHKRFNYWQREAKRELQPMLKAVGKSLHKIEKDVQIKPLIKKLEAKVADVRESASDIADDFGLNERQEQIYQAIKKTKQAGINSFAEQIANVTPRTLRRDLTRLEKLGLVEQVGKTKDSFYRLKS